MINYLVKDETIFKGYGINRYLILSSNENGRRVSIVIIWAGQYEYAYDIAKDGRVLLHDGI